MNENCRQMILSEDYYDILLYETVLRIGNTPYFGEGYCIQNIANDFGILYVDGSGLPPINYENYLYADIPNLYTLVQTITVPGTDQDTVSGETTGVDYEALSDSGILELQLSSLNLKGRGVLIGYLDTGIDYLNNAFRYSDGSSRIAAIWDQTIQSGTPPELFDYGSECN